MQMSSFPTLTPLHLLQFSVNNWTGMEQKDCVHSHLSIHPFLLCLSPSSSTATETGANVSAVVCGFDLTFTENGS